MEPKKALFIGRFQPLHLGHLKAIDYLSKKYPRLTIAIGSSNKRDEDNPISANDRLMLLRLATKRYNNLKFTFLADDSSNRLWTTKVKRRFDPKKYVICSMNPLVNSLLKKAGYKFDTLGYSQRYLLEGKKIRRLIRQNKSYSKRIPKEIQRWMKEKGENLINSQSPHHIH